MPLLDALRALTAFTPPRALPDCDLAELADVLAAHGLAPLASYQLEHGLAGAAAPPALRERLLGHYQAVANDNVLKLVGLRGALKLAADVPAVLLDGAAYVDWLYPHMAFRPVGDPRLALRAEDFPAFREAVKGALEATETRDGGRTAVFTDGRVPLLVQEGLFSGAPADGPLFERRIPYRAFGPRAARPSPEDALLATVGEQAVQGLLVPLLTFVDLRELLRLPLDAAYLRARAEALGLSRGLHGATLLVAHFFPEVADAAAAARPPLRFAERALVERVVEAAKDPTRLRRVRGAEEAARLVVAPRPGEGSAA